MGARVTNGLTPEQQKERLEIVRREAERERDRNDRFFKQANKSAHVRKRFLIGGFNCAANFVGNFVAQGAQSFRQQQLDHARMFGADRGVDHALHARHHGGGHAALDGAIVVLSALLLLAALAFLRFAPPFRKAVLDRADVKCSS